MLSSHHGYRRLWGVESLCTKRCSPYPQSPVTAGPLSYKNHYCHHYYHYCNKQSQFPLECLRALILGLRVFSAKARKVTLLHYYMLVQFQFCLLSRSCPLWLLPPPSRMRSQSRILHGISCHLASLLLIGGCTELISPAVLSTTALLPCSQAPRKNWARYITLCKTLPGLQWGCYLGTGLMPVPLRCLNGQASCTGAKKSKLCICHTYLRTNPYLSSSFFFWLGKDIWCYWGQPHAKVKLLKTLFPLSLSPFPSFHLSLLLVISAQRSSHKHLNTWIIRTPSGSLKWEVHSWGCFH